MILFVDDEMREMDSYKLELEMSKYTVVFEPDVDKALAFLEEAYNDIELLILDIMMPQGKNFEAARHEGLRTGVDFYESIRKTHPELPVIILTNVSDESVRERFNGEAYCWFRQKTRVLPYELAECVDEILKR